MDQSSCCYARRHWKQVYTINAHKIMAIYRVSEKVNELQIEITLEIFVLENQFAYFWKVKNLVTWLDKKYLKLGYLVKIDVR